MWMRGGELSSLFFFPPLFSSLSFFSVFWSLFFLWYSPCGGYYFYNKGVKKKQKHNDLRSLFFPFFDLFSLLSFFLSYYLSLSFSFLFPPFFFQSKGVTILLKGD